MTPDRIRAVAWDAVERNQRKGDGMANPLLETSPYESDGGHLIGRNPMEIPADVFGELFAAAPVGMSAIRAKCLDCAENAAEVRKCVSTTCPLWPLRMGRKPKGMREARGEKMDVVRTPPQRIKP